MIEIKNLCYSYSGSKPYILNNLNLLVDDGEYISIIGDNGCGKSTLIKLILKLLKPSKGEIKNSHLRIGYVPQKRDDVNLQFPITVYEMLDCYRKVLKVKDKNIVNKSLEMVNMINYKNSLMEELSGGQCQKIFIARALIGNPSLIILDEPSTGIDVKSQGEIYGIIKEINKNDNITIISVEHNLVAVKNNSKSIFHIKDGCGHLCSRNKFINEYIS